MKILLVEDDEELSGAIVEFLTDQRYAVDLAVDGESARWYVDNGAYDLIVLDWKIPPPSGIDLLRDWRQRGIGVPVLMLTGQSSVRHRVSGLDLGADDYLTKPFAFAEFDARVRSLLRRKDKALAELSAGDLLMDRGAFSVTVDGKPVVLTPKEFSLLEYLLVHRDQVVRRKELFEKVWESDYDASSNVMDVIVHRVRKKIDGERPDKLLHTVVGVGYVLKSRRTAVAP